MRRRNHYGYGAYRGKSKLRTFLKFVIAVLAVVLVLLVGAFFFLQRYMVVSSTGGIYFDLPFLNREEESPPPSETEETPSIVVVSPSPTPEPTPSPEPEPVYTRAVALPDSLIAGGGVQNLYAAGGLDLTAYTGGSDAAPILTMKGIDGLLGYTSAQTVAQSVGASSADTARNGDLTALCSAMDTAAYVSCFRDNTAPYQNNQLALRTSIGNWRGPGEIRWMTPENADVRAYLAGVCSELAGLGFDEIILDYAAFPTEGDLSLILTGDRYNPDTFSQTVDAFYQQVRQAIGTGENAPLLSIVTDKTTLAQGSNPLSGQTLSGLCAAADRLYVKLDGGDPADYYPALREAGMENPEENLVVILDQAPIGDLPYSWAVLPQ
ncbi:putative glycoside hydrolase [uncultured Pseudoflavonifractor sp.]|uniref:putative glycoside hydrolase n=1 Tax=uncultured Pseudoflavonifractor sp. TaxID=1221379 RepID=UPI0025CBEB6A|nr:putative glycoside hydrolase [uncultured Pseudoflavonifractor sp.]